MAERRMILGQAAPGAVNTILYAVPIGMEAVVSTVIVCNTDTGSATFRLAVVPEGGSPVAGNMLGFDVAVAANTPYEFTVGITLAETDELYCYASTSKVTFTAFGVEIDS
jgi:hypothetical protein